ncbi:MAG: transglutaminase domain-containing protein [Streptosporangiaceae bacterium]
MTPAVVPARTERRVPGLTLRLSRDEAVDALMLLALTVIGIAGFRDTYGGHAYLVAGAVGAVVGVVLSHVGHRARLPLLTVTAAGMLAFLLLGGLISQPGAAGGIPSLPTLHAVVNAAISGWEELLTTARPVGTAAHLLVLPYLLGVASGVAGHALARRTSRVLIPAAAPATVVALSILFGSDHATAAVLQGAGFTGLALAWAALRQQRGDEQHTTIGRQRPWQRVAAAAGVLAVAVAGATVIGPRLPGAGAHQRVVLQAVPPFDVAAYPSPLAAFRDYTQDASPSVRVYGKQLFTTTGLPSGSLIRIAAMDTYDGLVWGVANAQADTASFAGFQRIGAALPGASVGRPARIATITIDSAYQQPWLPDLAGITGFGFTGATGLAVQSALRFNVATATGIVPGVVLAGLRYTVRAADPAVPAAAQLANAVPYAAPDPSIVIPPVIQAFAAAHGAGASSPMARVLELAAYLKNNGRYSDGSGQANIAAGHSSGRLATFLQSAQITGDDEQYAAAMALLANAVGVPARVSLDGTVQPDGSIYGQDVHADIELDLAHYGWVTLPASQFTGTKTPTLKPHIVTPPPAPAQVVPPQSVNGAPVTANNSSNVASHASTGGPKHGGFVIPAIVLTILQDAGLPLLVLALIAIGLIGAKALRRRHRRHGPPADRVSGAWREVLDLGRDLGIASAGDATRREQAAHVERQGLAGVSAIAAAADAVVFGPEDPDDTAAGRIWALVEDSRHSTTAGLARWRRAWVAVNPASLSAAWNARVPHARPDRGWRDRSWRPHARRSHARRGPDVTTRPKRPDAVAGGTRR